MRRVFGLGETVLDIVFKNDLPVTAKAGGSVLNAMVSLARMGHECHFITELGHDKVGDMITGFLNDNKIGTRYLSRYQDGQSCLAMAFLNDNNDADYEFYKNYPEVRLKGALPDFKPNDILLFGSSYAIAPAIRQQLCHIVKHAKECGCIIIYDPNYRKKQGVNEQLFLRYLQENFAFADVVRGSNEDFDNIYDIAPSNQAFYDIKSKCANLIYTAAGHGVFLQSSTLKKHYQVPTLQPISTIGAGDNFNAGVIHAISDQNITKESLADLNENEWDALIHSGIGFASEVCQSLDNYVPAGFKL